MTLCLTPTLLLKLIPSAQPLLLYLEFTVPPILNSPITLEPLVQNMTSTSTQTNPPPAFSISSPGPESPPSVLTPELSSDFTYLRKVVTGVLLLLMQIVLPIKRRKFQQWLITVILI